MLKNNIKQAFSLEGIKVVETAAFFAGPIAGRFLADWGADVIHVEHPIRGDISRSIKYSSVSPAARRAGKLIDSNIDYEAENNNRNKRSMTLDLSNPLGRVILYRMIEKADVFLANFRPRELKKFKLEYRTLKHLNPRLIHANVTGYGESGPNKDTGGHDTLCFWARSGIMHIIQKPDMAPLITPTAMGDRITAIALALGIVTALFVRERTGIGQEVETSIFNVGVFAIGGDIAGSLVTGQDLQQPDRKDMQNALATFYQTKDGRWIRLSITQPDPYWSRFCRAIGRDDIEHDPRFATFEPRIRNYASLFDLLEGIFRSKTLHEWKIQLNQAGLLWAPVQNLPEVTSDPQARANNFFITYDHPVHGPIELVANPVRLSKTPERVRRPAPEFSQHTEEILLEYGYTWDAIEQLKQQQIIA